LEAAVLGRGAQPAVDGDGPGRLGGGEHLRECHGLRGCAGRQGVCVACTRRVATGRHGKDSVSMEVRSNNRNERYFPVPALPSSVINPLWDQFKTLLPAVNDHHPLGCHRPRVADRIIFDKLVTRLVLGGAYTKHADDRVSATTLRTRRDEWIAHDVFFRL